MDIPTPPPNFPPTEIATPIKPPKKKMWMIVVIVLLATVSIGTTGYLAYQNYQLKNPKPTTFEECASIRGSIIQTSYPAVCVTADGQRFTRILSEEEQKNLNPPNDQTADWKTYTNSIQHYTFKYAPDWQINIKQADEQQNSLLELTRNQEKLTIYANLYGIGGVGKDYQGTSITVSGIPLYEYKTLDTNGSMYVLGITDNLKQSLGVFKFNEKTYQITLTYPTFYNETTKGTDIQKEFDQILSTFTFTEK